jgi:hypothetical protein
LDDGEDIHLKEVFIVETLQGTGIMEGKSDCAKVGKMERTGREGEGMEGTN